MGPWKKGARAPLTTDPLVEALHVEDTDDPTPVPSVRDGFHRWADAAGRGKSEDDAAAERPRWRRGCRRGGAHRGTVRLAQESRGHPMRPPPPRPRPGSSRHRRHRRAANGPREADSLGHKLRTGG